MTLITITDEVAMMLADAASSRGCSQESLASMWIEEGLRAEQDFELTPQQVEIVKMRIEQADRGELIDGEIVMRKSNDFLSELEARESQEKP